MRGVRGVRGVRSKAFFPVQDVYACTPFQRAFKRRHDARAIAVASGHQHVALHTRAERARVRRVKVRRPADIQHRASRAAAARRLRVQPRVAYGAAVRLRSGGALSRFAHAGVQGAYSTRSLGRRLVDLAVIPCRHTRRAAQHKSASVWGTRARWEGLGM